MNSFSNLENTTFLKQAKKHAILVPPHTTDEIITNIEKLTLKIPNTDFKYTNNKHNFNIIDASSVCKNKTTKFENNISCDYVTSDCQTNTCSKLKINTINIQTNSKKNNHIKIMNDKQKNISFTGQKLWEINRVNQILHNKISGRVKSTYPIQYPSTFLIKATSTINRERKNKDIMKKNEVSFTQIKKKFFYLFVNLKKYLYSYLN